MQLAVRRRKRERERERERGNTASTQDDVAVDGINGSGF
jgi:hypothetical protein